MPNLIIQPTIPTIYKKILKDKISGELVIRRENLIKNLFFIEGNLVFARTNAAEERLGEILFKTGKIDTSQLNMIPEQIKDKRERIGRVLVKNNIITLRELYDALKEQIKTIGISLFSITSGEWDFNREVPEIPEDSKFKIKVPEIIVIGMNQMKSIPFFENQFYYQTPRTGIIPQSISKYLSDEEIKFYKELSTFSNLSSEKIIKALNISEEKFWGKINLFYFLNILEFDETSGTLEDTKIAIDPVVIEMIEEIIELYEQLKANKLDYYELLGVDKESTLEEIRESYRGLVKKYRPDKIRASKEINEKARFVFAEIERAYETLSIESKRRFYDGPPGNDMPIPAPQRQEDGRQQARELFLKGKGLHEQKKFMEAALILEKAVELDGTDPTYFILLGVAQAEIPMLRKKAEENLKKAAEMEPSNPEPLYALGLLYQGEDLPRKAEVFFRKAMELDVGHSLSGKIPLEEGGESSKKGTFFSLFGKRR